jgi:1,2-beta-oligoglucan phosphorylase
MSSTSRLTTPRDGDLGLKYIRNRTGLGVSVLPNGSLFAIEHERDNRRIMVNQVLGSPVGGGITRLYLRVEDAEAPLSIGPGANVTFGATEDRIVWVGETAGVRHRTTLWLAPDADVWLWRVDIVNKGGERLACDAILIQDLGLAPRGFVMNNEAYASQYIDHHIADDRQLGPVIMSRQNLAQSGVYPWAAHGCLDGAAGFATDAIQLFGPAFRDAEVINFGFGAKLPNKRLQHEAACAAIQSRPASIELGASVSWQFFGLYDPNHADASSDSDLLRIEAVRKAAAGFEPTETTLGNPLRSIVQGASAPIVPAMENREIARRYPERAHGERDGNHALSFFVRDGAHNRHIVLAAKERKIARRHGTILRTGQSMLPDEATLCATCWMHGVFGAQLTIGNTSLHKLFSVSRDAYNITRASGLRMLIDTGEGWRLLAVPSIFEIGLSDCRWIYLIGGRAVTVQAVASGDDPAMQWSVTVEGDPCRFLAFGQLVLGEREFDQSGRIEVENKRKRMSFRPGPDWLWGKRYPNAVYHLVTSTPEEVEAIGGDELLYLDGTPHSGGYAVLRTRLTHEFRFAVAGSLKDPAEAERLAAKYENGVGAASMLASAQRYWAHVTRDTHLNGAHADVAAFDTVFPWLAHNAMIHLTVPHGLEQYTAAAWGTRDVCQGPVEFLLALEHDEPVKDILRIVFAQQYENRGDWPQWFMLEPYSNIQDRHAHGDVIVWPLKALCDYLEATNDLAFLDEPVAWRRDDNFERTEVKAPIAVHADKLIATARAHSIPETRLMRYGEGDWNDSLQPADPKMRDWMVSSWTVALFYQQVRRYAEIVRRAGRDVESERLDAFAAEIREDFNRYLIRDGTVAGYALFEPDQAQPELLLHPSDTRTGLKYSLLPMTRSIIGRLFTPEQARHHLALIREHLLYPDGVRLMDRPVAYRGGPERVFRRAESAAFFGREIGLMYVHAHLRYAEAMAVLGEAEALWDALIKVNPIAVTEHLAGATLRQRNAYFSSSDAAFSDRYQASAEWERVRRGDIAVDGGWRIYSSGPGLYVNVLIRLALGRRRHFGERMSAPLVPIPS